VGFDDSNIKMGSKPLEAAMQVGRESAAGPGEWSATGNRDKEEGERQE
jgi:hypothetical protein